MTESPLRTSWSLCKKLWSFCCKKTPFGRIQIQNQSVSELLLFPLQKIKHATQARVDVPRTLTLCGLGRTPPPNPRRPRRLGCSPVWTEREVGPPIHLQPSPGTFAHGRVSCPNSSLSPAGLPPPFAFSITKSFIG